MAEPGDPQTKIGRYQVIASHGQDGIARIVTASDTETGRLVTLDILERGTKKEREAVIERARACQAFKDRQIYAVLSVQDEQSPALIVREHERGMSLGQALDADGPMPPHEAGRLTAKFARVLDRIHAAGLVHGRLSIELIRQDQPEAPFRIAGFGRPLNQVQAAQIHPDRLRYMAPEQLQEGQTDERSDLYTLGLIFYALLSGKPAFPANDPVLLAAQVSEADITGLESVAPHVPEPFRAIVNQLTNIDPSRRYRSGNALAEAIEKAMAQSQHVLPPLLPEASGPAAASAPAAARQAFWPGRLLVAGSAVLLIALAYWSWQDYQPGEDAPVVILPTNEPDTKSEREQAAAPQQLPQETSSDAALPAAPANSDWQTVLQEASLEGCTYLEQIPGRPDTVLSGVTSDPAKLVELDGMLRARGSADDIIWTAIEPASPPCAFLKAVLPLTRQPLQRFLRVQASEDPVTAKTGELLFADIDAPLDSQMVQPAWHVLAGYVTSHGEFVHLTGGNHALDGLEPGASARIGEPGKGEWFRFTDPGGSELVFALLSPGPLQIGSQRQIPIEDAIEQLRPQLEQFDPPAMLSLSVIDVTK